jgi:ABC-type sugar transport system ATPase subunit
VHKAQLTLFDEPLSNLDTKLRLEARAFLKYLQREVGITSVYVTHDQAEAMALADVIVVMNEGKIMQYGSPKYVYQTPMNVFVAGFIGSPPMNLIDCEVDPAGNALRFANGTVLPWHEPLPKGVQGKITLGIRPENLTIVTAGEPGSIPVNMYVTQMLGGESLIMTRLGSEIVSVRMLGDDPPEFPPQVGLLPDAKQVFFYGEDGNWLQ